MLIPSAKTSMTFIVNAVAFAEDETKRWTSIEPVIHASF